MAKAKGGELGDANLTVVSVDPDSLKSRVLGALADQMDPLQAQYSELHSELNTMLAGSRTVKEEKALRAKIGKLNDDGTLFQLKKLRNAVTREAEATPEGLTSITEQVAKSLGVE